MVLGSIDRQGVIVPTPLYQRLLETVTAIKPVHIGLDTSADCFAGNEIDRSQVRQFVGLLRQLAQAGDSSTVLLSHPSLTGMASGSGLSGSTAWHNSVRARLFLTVPGNGEDSDLRELRFLKNNYGPYNKQIILRFRDGVFVSETDAETVLAREKILAEIEATFLRILTQCSEQNRPLSPSSHAPNFAAKIMAGFPDNGGFSQRDFAGALERLLARKHVRIGTFGPPSKQRSYLIATPPAPEAPWGLFPRRLSSRCLPGSSRFLANPAAGPLIEPAKQPS